MGTIRIRCSDADCENGLHCYSRTTNLAGEPLAASREATSLLKLNDPLRRRCQVCGVYLVDWSRTHRRDTREVEYVVDMLNTEFVRHHFWHQEFNPWTLNYVRRKGRYGLRDAYEIRIRKSVAPNQPFRDGAQTPFDSPKDGRMALYCAQHATAACCRKCVAVWHGISEGIELSDADVRYLTNLGMEYFRRRLPNLSANPEVVPAIRT